MQPVELTVHLSAVAIVQQPVIALVVALVKQTVRVGATVAVVLLAIADAQISVGEAAPMDALLLVL